MGEQSLVETIRSLGAFIPEKFHGLWSEKVRLTAEDIFRGFANDISISTGALYLAMRLPMSDPFTSMVKQHFTNLKTLEPKTGVETNNMAFAYEEMGFYLDRSSKCTPAKRIADYFGIGGFRHVQPIYEKAIEKDSKLWEPRYNIAQGLIGLASWCENPEQDELDLERAFEELTTVVALDPRNVPARIRLAQWFYLQGIDSIQLFREVLEIDPTNKTAREELERFQNYAQDQPGQVYFEVGTN